MELRTFPYEMDQIIQTTSTITFKDRWDHFLARCGIGRMQHRVQPGLYSLGLPDRGSPVFVTGNYTLSFDALRAALQDQNAIILVLDTNGVNVWCAAGKGTFGTDELVSKIKSTGLDGAVDHRCLILPQLGATGVSAHDVKKQSGFEVEYGPVRADDITGYLKEHHATPAMRQVRFNMGDRLVLAPVEMVNTFLTMLIIAGVMYLLGGWFNVLWTLAAWLAATLVFFMLLPWLPSRDFSAKGLILGAVVAIPFVIFQFLQVQNTAWHNLMRVLPVGLILTAMISYVTLNMTGSTPITSWTSVRREIFKYIPILAIMGGAGIVLTILRFFGFGN